VIDRPTNRSITSFFPSHDTPAKRGLSTIPVTQGSRSPLQLSQLLKTWYRITVGGAGGFPFPSLAQDDEDADTKALAPLPLEECQMTESYICSVHHKAYALRKDRLEMFALFTPETPTFALRGLLNQVLSNVAALF
jgi:hypothetical protein